MTNNVEKKKNFRHFIGIDVSCNELDYAVMRGSKLLFHREASNDTNSIKAFIQELKELPQFMIAKTAFCMEYTGIYCNHLLSVFKSLKANIVIENSLQIRSSLGVIRGKYDKIDAIRIAQYAYINRDHLNIREFKRPIIIQLASLFTLRNRLIGVRASLKTPLTSQLAFVKKGIQKEVINGCKGTIKALDEDITNIENTIDLLINSDERLNRLNKIVTSVPCIGRVMSIQMIISTNEFLDITTAKKFACYAGVAPFIVESGNLKGKARVSKIGNKKAKSLLHICALSAIRPNGELRNYYDRKVAEGKNKMAVLNAVRNKLNLRIFACVSEDRLYKRNIINGEIKGHLR